MKRLSPMPAPTHEEVEPIEVALLLEAIRRRYGLDFRHYAVASLRRRIELAMRREGLATVSALQARILRDERCMAKFLDAASVNVTALFRDPGFYGAVRAQVVPLLAGLPMLRIWHAGCATGMEVYSMAILLHEEGLLKRTRIYATDMNQSVIDTAKAGVYPQQDMQQYTRNYIKAGGTAAFSDYYTAKFDRIIMRPSLGKSIVWAQHNLVTDGSFNEFQLVLCRNVMIYFDLELQDRVHRLLYDSLAPGGVLGLGRKETLRFASTARLYESIDDDERLFRKVR